MPERRLVRSKVKPVFPALPVALILITLALMLVVLKPATERQRMLHAPSATHAERASLRLSHSVSVEQDGELSLDGQAVNQEQLQTLLAGHLKREPGVQVLVLGVRGTPYEKVRGVVDSLRAMGVQDIRLQVTSTRQNGRP